MKNIRKQISIMLIFLMLFTVVQAKAVKIVAAETGNTAPVAKSEHKIIGEVLEKREKNVKTFMLDDHSYEAAVYPMAVHYNDNGAWKDIDNSLAAETDENNNEVLGNKANDFKVKFAKKSNSDKLVRITKDKYEISWGLEGALKTDAAIASPDESMISSLSDNDKKAAIKNAESSTEYKGILSDIDLQYNLLGDKVKENIILNNKIDNPEFTFDINTKNLVPSLQKDNSIIFYDKNDQNKPVYRIDAPVMYDANKVVSSNIGISITESKDKKGYVLTIKPDNDWVNSSDRKMPIVVDPTTSTSLDSTAIHDTFVASNDTSNKWLNIFLRTGQTPSIGMTRTYIKFDLPNFSTGDMVTSAVLNLRYSSPDSYNNGNGVNVHKVTQNFDPTNLYWSTQPSYDPRVVDYKIVYSGNGDSWVGWDITSIAKEWVTTGNNNGLMLEGDNTAGFYSAFYSSDTGASIAWARPQVIFNYVNNNGLEGYWTYHSSTAGRAGTSYVNDYNGNMVAIHNDISMNGNRMPITINHIFNSNDKNSTDLPYGSGWRLNISQRVDSVTSGSQNYFKYIDEDGTAHYFSDNGAQQLSDELNLGLTLIKETDGSFSIKDKKDNKLNFFGATRDLNYIMDSNNNKMTFEYFSIPATGKRAIHYVDDGVNRKVTLDYDASGKLWKITDPSSRVVATYGYNGNQLNTITYADGKVTTYNYSSDGNLTDLINYDGYKTSYQYYSIAPYRVKDVLESNNGTLGNELAISYGNNTTSFTDELGRRVLYQFDNAGKTISLKDSEGNAQYYSYDSSNITKISNESKLQKTIVNLMNNHDCEGTSLWSFGKDGGNGSSGFTTEAAYYGQQGLKITKTDNVSRQYANEYITGQKGKTYTFSGYVRTVNVSNTNGDGATISAYYKDNTGTYRMVESKPVTGTTDWQRLDVTFTIPSDATDGTIVARANMLYETGTAYFDSFQLEEGSAANRYNLVDNGDFSDTSLASWNKYNFGANDGIATNTDSSHPSNLDQNCILINGNSNLQKNVYQTVNVSGNAGDSFIISAWAKADSVPMLDGSGRNFALTIGFRHTDGSYKWVDIPCNTGVSEWQYVSGVVLADQPYTSINIYGVYYNNANSAYFDGFQLYKEEFGTSYVYDSKGNVTSTANEAKEKSKFNYDGNNNLISSTDAKGNSFTYTYDGNHNMLTAASAESVQYSFTYDTTNGNALTSKIGDDTNFIKSTAAYTANGNYMTSMTDSEGHTVNYNYDQTKGTLNSVTDPNGKTTNYTYDQNLDRLTDANKVVDNNTNPKKAENAYTYENDRLKNINVKGISYPAGTTDFVNTPGTVEYNETYNFGYDSLGNNTTVQVGNQNLITNSYEARTSRLLSSTYGNGQVVSSDYDNMDRVTAKKVGTTSGGTATRFTYQYNASGNLGTLQDLVNSRSYKYLYDLSDRLVAVSETNTANSQERKTNFEYDLNNNISKVYEQIDPYTYNNVSLNKPAYASSYQDPSAFPASYAFDGNTGTRWSSAYSDPQWIYVDLGAPTNINRVILSWELAYADQYDIQVSNDATNWTTIYSTTNGDGGIDDIKGLNANGRYVRMYGKHRMTTAGYSLWDFSVYSDNTLSTQYGYDKDNKLSTITYLRNSLNTINYTYDNLARLTNKSINTGSYTYPISYAYKAGVTDTTQSTTNGKTMTTTKIASITNGSSTPISYDYDKNGNISTITQGTSTIGYQYNELNELVREDNQALGKTITYSYDENGNILTKTEYAYTTGTLGASTKTYSYTYGDANWSDKLQSYDGKSISYDAIGNPTAFTANNISWTAAWEAGRQLQGLSASGQSLTFKYNDAGIRTEKNYNGVVTKYHLVGDKVTYEENGTDKIYYTYDNAGKLVSMNLNGIEYYYIRNAQGDIIGLIDKTGAQVVSYTYDSWGKLISTIGTLASTVGAKNPYRYRGYRYDTETGLYYLNSRYYNPEWGRFINVDGIVGKKADLLSYNMFSYSKNNPVNMSDPSGYVALSDNGEFGSGNYNPYISVITTPTQGVAPTNKTHATNNEVVKSGAESFAESTTFSTLEYATENVTWATLRNGIPVILDDISPFFKVAGLLTSVASMASNNTGDYTFWEGVTRTGIDAAALGAGIFLGTALTGGVGLAVGIGISFAAEGVKALIHKWF